MKSRLASIAWSITYLLLLLSLVTPFTFITVLLIMLPTTILYATLTTKSFVYHIVPVFLIVMIVMGSWSIFLPLYFLIPSIVMGHFYKKRASVLRTVMFGAGTILAEFLLLLLISTLFFDFNLAHTIENIVNTAATPFRSATGGSLATELKLSDQDTQQISTLTVQTIPFTLIITSLAMATITHAIARPTLASLGQITPKMMPLREWRLPRALIWYYCIVLLIELFGGSSAKEGFLGTVVLNLLPMLQFAFIIQSAGFFFYIAHTKKWNKGIPILLTVLMLFIRPLWLIGLFDIAFPLRDMITRSRR
ncbi:uncharacterized protein YybS (DUF2232 family) [Paenibacillus shirakamiensis]|uniref:Uncharacterized protein YybS (DUF2232 family) n=1 Tax=Paenibacillus shirakamiensis TaxID=1265935 RepID=A0ABS4JKT7_9BACL|nr:DUF2232 domain-containing protein [Paenibacillus shirakamiensis]MBP2002329.1 uncharacterized protein YybS (DUF2232 family) [Paenibacillus shirakamiensis]